MSRPPKDEIIDALLAGDRERYEQALAPLYEAEYDDEPCPPPAPTPPPIQPGVTPPPVPAQPSQPTAMHPASRQRLLPNGTPGLIHAEDWSRYKNTDDLRNALHGEHYYSGTPFVDSPNRELATLGPDFEGHPRFRGLLPAGTPAEAQAHSRTDLRTRTNHVWHHILFQFPMTWRTWGVPRSQLPWGDGPVGARGAAPGCKAQFISHADYPSGHGAGRLGIEFIGNRGDLIWDAINDSKSFAVRDFYLKDATVFGFNQPGDPEGWGTDQSPAREAGRTIHSIMHAIRDDDGFGLTAELFWYDDGTAPHRVAKMRCRFRPEHCIPANVMPKFSLATGFENYNRPKNAPDTYVDQLIRNVVNGEINADPFKFAGI